MRPVPGGNYKWLLLPCLNKVREFDGKLLLAATAAERGWGAIVGYKGFIEGDVFDVAGVVIERSFKSRDLGRHASAHRRVCALDEEGLVFTSPADYYHRRLRLSSLRRLDAGFLWGQNQKDIVLSYAPEIESKLHVTGSPRFDMLRPELVDFYRQEVARLVARYGNFILINTNFGFINHYFGREYSLRDLKNQGTVTTPEQEQDQSAREEHEASIMRAFMEALPLLRASFPDQNVIIRPHPSENFDTWRRQARDFPNVFVAHEGDIVPWLLAAGATIHNSCTTGIQSYLLGKPALAYMPARSQKYDKPLPNSLSIVAETPRALVASLRKMLSHAAVVDRQQELEWELIAQRHVEGISGPWAADRMMDVLEELAVEPQPLAYRRFSIPGAIGGPHWDLRSQAARVRSRLRGIVVSGNRTPHNRATEQEYINQTFPPLDMAQVQESLLRLRQVTGRFSGIQVCQTGDTHVCVYPVGD